MKTHMHKRLGQSGCFVQGHRQAMPRCNSSFSSFTVSQLGKAAGGPDREGYGHITSGKSLARSSKSLIREAEIAYVSVAGDGGATSRTGVNTIRVVSRTADKGSQNRCSAMSLGSSYRSHFSLFFSPAVCFDRPPWLRMPLIRALSRCRLDHSQFRFCWAAPFSVNGQSLFGITCLPIFYAFSGIYSGRIGTYAIDFGAGTCVADMGCTIDVTGWMSAFSEQTGCCQCCLETERLE